MQSWYSVPLRVLGQGPFLNKNAQPASKSYLVLGEGQAPLGWVRADSFLLSHCLSETGSKSSPEEDTPLCPFCGPLRLRCFCHSDGVIIMVSGPQCS